ncbi:MAG: hypothetical protein IJ113_08825 [Eggerthellaceae bacterium]|nr:hypothetical protein [Eggerthellaceae bacterium]
MASMIEWNTFPIYNSTYEEEYGRSDVLTRMMQKLSFKNINRLQQRHLGKTKKKGSKKSKNSEPRLSEGMVKTNSHEALTSPQVQK